MHVGLADLIQLDDGSELQRAWTDKLVARWAGQRAANLAAGGDGAAWLAGPSANGIICDAVLFPLVTGDPDLSTLDVLLKTAIELDRQLRQHDAETQPEEDAQDGTGREVTAAAGQDEPARWLQDRDADATRVRELMAEFVGGCVRLLSGEPGLAAYLRRNLFAGTALDGKSLPLDVGNVDDIPWWIRKAVATRDQRCTWPGGCNRPAWDCEPHHVIHRASHGATAVCNLSLLCWFHHHVVIHKWGWDFKVNGDGGTQATSPDGRVYRSNSRPPPPRAG